MEEKEETEICELRLPIWAVIDGVNCFGIGLTYAEAESKAEECRGKCTVVTQAVAERLPKI